MKLFDILEIYLATKRHFRKLTLFIVYCAVFVSPAYAQHYKLEVQVHIDDELYFYPEYDTILDQWERDDRWKKWWKIKNQNNKSEQKVFQIIPKEVGLANIPICAYSFVKDRYEQTIETEFALTDSSGVAKIIFSDDYLLPPFIWLDINGGRDRKKSHETGNTECESEVKKYLRDELAGEGLKIDGGYYVNEKKHKGEVIKVPINLGYDGELLKMSNQIEGLVKNASSFKLGEAIDVLNDLIGLETPFGNKFPTSCQQIRSNITELVEQNRQNIANGAYKKHQYKVALEVYQDLYYSVPNSRFYLLYQSRLDSCFSFIEMERQIDSMRKQCDSILTNSEYFSDYSCAISFLDSSLTKFSRQDSCFKRVEFKIKELRSRIQAQQFDSLRGKCDTIIINAGHISNYSKAIGFLKSSLTKIQNSDPCFERIQVKIEELNRAIQVQKQEEKYNRLVNEDKKALKRFKVDMEISQVDFFTNPFAFNGQNIFITCVVKKFETPTSAIMNAAEEFYADFKITPPKKFDALHLIVKVKGVTTLYNAFGTPIKVPHVDVVHILNFPPDE